MDNPLLPVKASGLNISSDYPFRDDVIRWEESKKSATRTTPQLGGYKQTKITIIEQTTYYPSRHTKLYHQKLKSIITDLSPSAAWIFMYITLNIEFQATQIQIHQDKLPMSRPTASKALIELMSYNIIRKVENKKQWYWVNVTMILIGHINNPDDWNDVEVVE